MLLITGTALPIASQYRNVVAEEKNTQSNNRGHQSVVIGGG